MAQEAAKIYVEHVASRLQHDVVIVSVTDAQDVRGHAAAGTGIDEVLHGLGGGKENGEGIKLSWKDSRATARLNSASSGLFLMSPNSTAHLPVQPSSQSNLHTAAPRMSPASYRAGGDPQSLAGVAQLVSMNIFTTISEIHLPLHYI